MGMKIIWRLQKWRIFKYHQTSSSCRFLSRILVITLNLKQGNVLINELRVVEAYRLLKESVVEIRTKGLVISDPLIRPEVSFKVFSELTKTISNAKTVNRRESVLDRLPFLDRLPKSTKDDILHHWTLIKELEEHFWFSYPITKHLSFYQSW